MRTTISLDDQLARRVRREAAEQGLSMSSFIAKTLHDALKRGDPSGQRRFGLSLTEVVDRVAVWTWTDRALLTSLTTSVISGLDEAALPR